MNYNAAVHQGALQMFWHHSYKVIKTEETLLRSQVYITDVPAFRGIPSFLLQRFLRVECWDLFFIQLTQASKDKHFCLL